MMRGASFASSFPTSFTTSFNNNFPSTGRRRRRRRNSRRVFGERRKPVLVVVVVVSAEHRRVAHFVNLKNGIEALPVLREHFPEDAPIHFLRVQSTLCERGDMEKIMLELDANLLLKLATDTPCVIYDYGSRSEDTGLPRSFWYGMEAMMYFLRYEWGFDGYGDDRDDDGNITKREVVLRGKKCTKEIERKRTFFSKSLKKKLRYYRQFIPETHSKELRMIGAYKLTTNDGDREYYKKTLNEYISSTNEIAKEEEEEEEEENSRINNDSLEETATKLESLGFKIFRGGDREQDWLDMIKSN